MNFFKTFSLLLILPLNIFAQVELKKLNSEIYEGDYEYIYYSIKFNINFVDGKLSYIPKGAILLPQDKNDQITVVCDIDKNRSTCDEVIEHNDYWSFKFNNLKKDYNIVLKTFCMERGKEIPTISNTEELISIFSGEKVPIESLKTVCKCRENAQKQIDKIGADSWASIIFNYSGESSWDSTLSELIINKIGLVLNFASNYNNFIKTYNIQNNINNDGTIKASSYIVNKKNNEKLYKIDFELDTPPHVSKSKTYIYKNIKWKTTRLFD